MFSIIPPRRLLKIAVIAHIRFPIRAPFKGGMEAHSHALVRGLEARGHEVRLFAAGDSDPDLPLEAVCERHYERHMPWARWRDRPGFAMMQQSVFENAWSKVDAFAPDVIHNNSLFHALPEWAKRDGKAMVSVLHVPPFPRLHASVTAALDHQGQRFATVSASQRGAWSPSPSPHLSVVHNGIDGERWSPPRDAAERSGAIWVGRITPSKGTAHACRAALSAGVDLTLYGPIEDETYFARAVAPLLGSRVRHAGELEAAELAGAYRAAEVALVTPCWDEPFGLVAAEALACGTPVAGFDRGAIGEVVGDAGRLVTEGDIEGLAAAILEARRIPEATCTGRAGLFTTAAMLDGYEALYDAAIEGAAASRASSCSRMTAELA